MTTNRPLTPAEVADRGVEALLRELGPADTARFIRIATDGSGDYTVDRVVRFAGLTVDDLMAEMEALRRANAPSTAAS